MRQRLLLRLFLLRIAALAALAVSACAQAQIIDTIEVTRDGTNALVRIRFSALIQYLRHAPQSEGENVQVFFQITAGNESVQGTREEQRRSPPNDLLPRFDVEYPPQAPSGNRRIEIRFQEVTRYRLRPEDNRTILLVIPLSEETLARLAPPRPAGVEPPPTTSQPTTELDKEVVPLINAGREALANAKFEDAALAFNRVLNLPPNAFSQEAQELIGVARERLGETAKAKAEYELYLKLYPDGPGADRVRARLAEITVATYAGTGPAEAPLAFTRWGSISQYYYGGQSRIETTTTTVTPATNATTIDVARLSSVDQKQLTTNLDATGRWRQGPWDTRMVVRDSYTYSFLDNGKSANQLTAAYVETRNATTNLLGRAGRMTGTSSGVLGRYDGGWISWGMRPDLRINGVVGTPVGTAGPTATFVGASVDIENPLPGTAMQLFGIYQRVSGYTDRTGLGGEVRYFDPNRTLYALLDYDPTFRAVNIAMAQGSWQFGNGFAMNLLADYRRTPTLQLTNLLLPFPGGNFQQIVSTIGVDAARKLAKDFTPISKVYLVGMTQQVTTQWQLGLDVRLASLTGTPATDLSPAQPGTGNVYAYTLQAIGTSLVPQWRDILVLNGNVLNGKLVDGWQVGFDYRFNPIDPLTIEPMYRYYQQDDNLGAHVVRHLPGLRVTYYLRERLSVEGEYQMEKAKLESATLNDDATRHFWYVGWRWDF